MVALRVDDMPIVPVRLTPREKQILECWAAGLLDKQAASLLHVSHSRTKHLSEVVRAKLGSSQTRAQAVAVAIRLGLID